MRYPVEKFTPEEQRLLATHFTNLDRPVFALVNLPETVKGALFARYSRYSGTVRRLYLEEFAADAPADGRPFDLVITDLGMPYVDGRQVARELKSEFPSTPILMLTGWGAFIKDDGSMPAQVDGVLSKPPRSKELRDILCRVATPPRRGPVRRQTTVVA